MVRDRKPESFERIPNAFPKLFAATWLVLVRVGGLGGLSTLVVLPPPILNADLNF